MTRLWRKLVALWRREQLIRLMVTERRRRERRRQPDRRRNP